MLVGHSVPLTLPLTPPGQGFHLGGYDAYCASKLAVCMWTYRLARLLADRSHSCVTANVLDPGTVNTKLLFSAFGAAADQAMRVEVGGPLGWGFPLASVLVGAGMWGPVLAGAQCRWARTWPGADIAARS